MATLAVVSRPISRHSAKNCDGGLVALGRRLRGVETVRLQQHARPAFPGALDLMGLGQSQQMPLGGEDLPVSVAERRAQITGLAGLLGDDQDRHGRQPDLNPLMLQPWDGTYPEPLREAAAS